jgi:hypothetical protein
MEKTLKFEFTVEQVNLILASLGRMPYEAVAQMISEVQKQAQEQIKENGVRTVGPPPN